jgi:pyruvate kinase
MRRQTKIVATLGPASYGQETLAKLLDAGVDVVRINLAHGTQERAKTVVDHVRHLARKQGHLVQVMVDLMGPRYRLGSLPSPLSLASDREVVLGVGPDADLPLDDASVLRYLRAGERILIDNGLVEIRILECRGDEATAVVINGGPVSTRKILNLPDTSLPFQISGKDRSDLEFAIREARADLVVISFVGGPADVEEVRRIAEGFGKASPRLFAKIERAIAVENLETIAAAADGILVSTGDLFVELPVHQVPVHLKRIVDCGHRLGKKVMLATQMLESMMEYRRPTSAEAVGIANAVFSKADALVLSAETAAGRYPVEAVRTMEQLIQETEAYMASSAATAAGSGDGRPSRSQIHRSIEFPPEYRESGIAILSYFSKIVQSKYRDLEVGVTIGQLGNKVTLVVETPEGKKEAIEQTLAEYGMVVLGEMAPEELLDSKIEALALRQELRLAQVRIEGLKEIGILQNETLRDLNRMLALSIQSRGQTTIIEGPTAIAVAAASATANLQQLRILQGGLSELEQTLPKDSEERSEVSEAREALEKVSREDDPRTIARSGAMNKLRRFLERLGDDKSPVAKTVRGIRQGIEIAQGIARAYNAVADWCGLPHVPKPFVEAGKKPDEARNV